MFNNKNKGNQNTPPAKKEDSILEILGPGAPSRLGLSQEEKINILEAQKAYLEGVATLRDLLAPSAMRVTSRYVQIGEYFSRTLFVYTYPRYLHTDWFTPVINMDAIFDVGMFIYPQSSNTVLKNLTKTLAKISSSIAVEQEQGKVRNPVLESAYKNVEALRDSLQQGTERLFKFALYITIYGSSLKQLNKNTKRVENLLGSRLIYTKQAVFQAEQGFISTLPLGNDEIFITNNLNTSPLSTSFPFVSYELSSNEGILYGINRHNNSLVLFDRFSLENANAVVFGKSGAGKSYAIKLEILRSLMLGADVLVIDPENEYKYLANAVGGSFLEISLASPYRINPFDLTIVSHETNPTDILREAIINLKGLAKLILGGVTPEADALLDEVLIQTYASKGITPDTSWEGKEMPTMTDFERILQSTEGAQSIAQVFSKFTEGTFAGIFNEPTNISLDKQFVVFSIRDLEDELRPIGMYIVLNYIWNIVRAELKKRILMVDEAWWLMEHEDSAMFLFSIAKRARKYYLGLTTISQDVNDFLSTRHGQAIVTNSSIQLLLRQSPAAIDLVASVFHLTQEEKYLLLASDVGEGIFFAGNKHVAIKIVASYSEDQIITSDPKQLIEIARAKEDFARAQGQNGVEMSANEGMEVNEDETKSAE
ncbi:MAG: ATP-binding protein [Candidatus Doudnabacteria bacterium]